MAVTIAVLREMAPGERRVALGPEVVKKLVAQGAELLVQSGAGSGARILDEAYVGAKHLEDEAEILARADLLLCVQAPSAERIGRLKEGAAILGQFSPYRGEDHIRAAMARRHSVFALELLPRTTRAQAMDVLSSQAAVSGYKAALIGAEHCVKFFPMLTTAAGTLRPAKVLVIGAGVAGLQAIATARRLGAMVEGYDVRPETKEQVESLGAKFLELGVSAAGSGGYARELTAEERAEQQRRLGEHLGGIDVVITTAAVPGRAAPKILSAAMVGNMKPGAVVVDLAAEGGGNCELTRPGEVAEQAGVTIVGPLNLPSMAPLHASEMYARNLANFLPLIVRENALSPDYEDDLVVGSCLVRDGEIVHAATRERLGVST